MPIYKHANGVAAMWTSSFSKVYPGIKPADIWRLWADIDNWPKWHNDLEYCKIEGPFKIGNHFILKPKTMGPVKIMLIDVKEGHSFTDCTTFFGAKMLDTHAMQETAEGLLLSNHLTVTGPLKWLWIKLVARHVADTIAEETEALVKLARDRHE